MYDDPTFLKQQFLRIHGYELNLENPKTFSEKMQWIKVYGNLERRAIYTDKYEVRKFVKEKIGEQYVVPLIGMYENVDDIDFESLPKSFAMKATHGSGWNIIVRDKSVIDWNAVKKEIMGWVRSNYYEVAGERNYKPLKGRIVVEEFLQDPSGDLKDFKFFCFHGKPMYIQVDGDRFRGHRRDIYDLHWNRLPVQIHFKNLREAAEKPNRLDEMIQIAALLSERMAFVRVDLYFTNNRIYFGELTFVPGIGLERFNPVKFDEVFGKSIDLSKYHQE